MFEHAGKIKKWLEKQGYKMEYSYTEKYIRGGGFYRTFVFREDYYRVSDERSISVKIDGCRQYMLYDKGDGHLLEAADTQKMFIERIKKYFPEKEG